MATVLIVEDNKHTQILSTARLKQEFEVLVANDGLEALDIIYEKNIDIIVSDIMMPNMDGYELLETLRAEGYTLPIVLLTAKETFADKKQGFNAGTDDYMIKPVDYDELILRIHALLRRSNIASKSEITLPTISIDLVSYSIYWYNNSIILPKKEFELLYKLLSYPDVIFTKTQLLDEIWGYDTDSSEDTIKTHINRLRTKFSECSDFTIITIKGLGYKVMINREN